MKEFLAACGYVLLLGGAGSAIGAWLRPRPRKMLGAAAGNETAVNVEPLGWGWSYLIGTAVFGAFLYVPLAVRGKISRDFLLIGAVLCLLLTLWNMWNLWRQLSFRKAGLAIRRIWIFALPWPVACVLAVVFLAAFLSVAMTRPSTFDARATFALKGRLLYDIGTIRGEDFQDVERMHFNAHYPMLIPLHEATIFRLQRSMNDRCLRFLFFGYVLALGSIIARELRSTHTPTAGALITAALVCMPLVIQTREGAGLTSSVDLPLACYVTAAGIACMRWLRTRAPQEAILAALMLGAGVLTKSEGMLWVAAIGATMLILVLCRRFTIDRALLKNCAAGVGVLAVMLALFMAVRRQIPYSPYLRSYGAAVLDWEWVRQLWLRPVQVAAFWIRDCLRPGYWNWAWICIPAALVLRRKQKLPTEILFARILLIIMALTFYVVFVITPYHVYWQMGTALHRLILQLVPLAWLVAAENLAATGWISKFQDLWGLPRELHAFQAVGRVAHDGELEALPLRRAG